MFLSCIVLRTEVSGRLCGLSGPNVHTFQQAILQLRLAWNSETVLCFSLNLLAWVLVNHWRHNKHDRMPVRPTNVVPLAWLESRSWGLPLGGCTTGSSHPVTRPTKGCGDVIPVCPVGCSQYHSPHCFCTFWCEINLDFPQGRHRCSMQQTA